MSSARLDTPFGFLRRSFRILNEGEKRGLVWMFILIVANSFVDILGLAAVLPVIGVVLDPGQIQTNEILKVVFEAGRRLHPSLTAEGFMIALALSMVGAFFCKAVFGLLISWVQSRFGYRISFRMTGVMWSYHFGHSLEEMRSKDSGKVLAEITSWPGGFTNTFVVGGLKLINELFVIALIAVGLLVYSPIVLASVSAILIVGVVIVRGVTKNRVHAYGRQFKELGPRSNTLVTNAVRGFLEVITFQATAAVRDNFLGNLWSIIRISTRQSVINNFPSKMYEVLSIAAIAGAIIVGLLLKTGSTEFFTLLTLMALASYRVMPSMNRLAASVLSMRTNWYFLEAMEKAEARRMLGASADLLQDVHIEMGDVIVCENLTLGYRALPMPVLEDLSLDLEMGKIHCLVGPSGCGKSTLMNAILGLHEPDVGQIWLRSASGKSKGTLFQALPVQAWLGNMAYLSQQPFLFRGSVLENLTMGVEGRSVDEMVFLNWVERLQLSDCLGEVPLEFLLNEGASNLSGGQQQRLALLRALLMDKPILVLDEATSALDTQTRDGVFEVLQDITNRGGMVILITHDRELAAKCDQVVDLEHHQ